MMSYPIFYSDKYKSIEWQFNPDTDISISNGLLEIEWDDGSYYSKRVYHRMLSYDICALIALWDEVYGTMPRKG